MKRRVPASAQWRSWKTSTTGDVVASRSKNVRQALNSSSVGISVLTPTSSSNARSTQSRSGSSPMCSSSMAPIATRVVRLVGRSRSSRARARTMSASAQKVMPWS